MLFIIYTKNVKDLLRNRRSHREMCQREMKPSHRPLIINTKSLETKKKKGRQCGSGSTNDVIIVLRLHCFRLSLMAPSPLRKRIPFIYRPRRPFKPKKEKKNRELGYKVKSYMLPRSGNANNIHHGSRGGSEPEAIKCPEDKVIVVFIESIFNAIFI